MSSIAAPAPLPGARAISQHELLRTLRERSQVVDERVRAAAGALDADALHRAPPTGGWSAAQVLEHLTIAGRSYLDRLRPALAADAPRRADAAAPWRPSFSGRFLVRSLAPSRTRGLPSPRIWRVDARPRPDVLDAFLATQDELRALLAAAEPIDLNAVRVSSPVTRIIRMNAGDALAVVVVHAERHAGQIERAVGVA